MHILLALVLCVSIACAQAPFNTPGTVVVPPVAQPIPDQLNAPGMVVVSLPPSTPVVNTPPPKEVSTPDPLPPPPPPPPTPVTNTPPTAPPKPLVNIPQVPPRRDRNVPVVWLCDQTGTRRAQAATPEAEKLIDQGVKLSDCVNQGRRIPPPPRGGAGMMCDTNGRPRGRASSSYIQALIRRGTQLTPCDGNQGGQIPLVPPVRPPRGGGASDLMCDANGRPRGRASSAYIQALIRRGTQLTPCNAANGAANPVANPVVANPGVVGNRFGGRILPVGNQIGGAGMMCDANGRPRGRASSAYIQALIRRGTQLTPCPVQAARANAGDAGTFSGPTATPGWAIALIVVSSLVIVLLLVVVVRLTQILKKN